MARYEIIGGKPLNGTVTISGAKNAAVAILPAALLVKGKCRIENVPDISDVHVILEILEGMGAVITYPETGVVEIDSTDVTSNSMTENGAGNHSRESLMVCDLVMIFSTMLYAWISS